MNMSMSNVGHVDLNGLSQLDVVGLLNILRLSQCQTSLH